MSLNNDINFSDGPAQQSDSFLPPSVLKRRMAVTPKPEQPMLLRTITQTVPSQQQRRSSFPSYGNDHRRCSSTFSSPRPSLSLIKTTVGKPRFKWISKEIVHASRAYIDHGKLIMDFFNKSHGGDDSLQQASHEAELVVVADVQVEPEKSPSISSIVDTCTDLDSLFNHTDENDIQKSPSKINLPIGLKLDMLDSDFDNHLL